MSYYDEYYQQRKSKGRRLENPKNRRKVWHSKGGIPQKHCDWGRMIWLCNATTRQVMKDLIREELNGCDFQGQYRRRSKRCGPLFYN